MSVTDQQQIAGSQVSDSKPDQTQRSVSGPGKASPPPLQRPKPGRMPLFRK